MTAIAPNHWYFSTLWPRVLIVWFTY